MDVFDAAWVQLHSQGKCEPLGSEQYQACKEEWQRFGEMFAAMIHILSYTGKMTVRSITELPGKDGA